MRGLSEPQDVDVDVDEIFLFSTLLTINVMMTAKSLVKSSRRTMMTVTSRGCSPM